MINKFLVLVSIALLSCTYDDQSSSRAEVGGLDIVYIEDKGVCFAMVHRQWSAIDKRSEAIGFTYLPCSRVPAEDR